MRNGRAGGIDGDHILLGVFDALADGFGHFSSLTQAVADLTLTVADHHQRGKLHHAAAFDGLGNTVEVDDFFDIFALFSFKSCHCSVPPPV